MMAHYLSQWWPSSLTYLCNTRLQSVYQINQGGWLQAANINNTWYPTLTHWDRVTHICVGKLTIIGSDIGLSPGRRQTIIWTNAGILLIRPLETNFSDILIGFFSRKCTWKCRLPNGVHLSRPQCVKIYHHHSPHRPQTFVLVPMLSFPVTYQRNCPHK